MLTKENRFVPYQPSFWLDLFNYTELRPLQYHTRMLCYQFDMPEQETTVMIVPDGCIDIMFFCTASDTKAIVYGSCMKKKWFTLQAGCRCLGVRLPTEDFAIRMGCPASDLTDKELPLLDLVPEIRPLLVNLHCKATCNDLNQIIQAIVMPGVSFSRQPSLIRYVLDCIHDRKGHVDLLGLANETGYSIRYIDKLFQKYVGLNPKLLCRIIRFQHLLEHILTNPQIKLVELAASLHYYDQSHLNREFQHFYHLSPQQLYRLVGEKKKKWVAG